MTNAAVLLVATGLCGVFICLLFLVVDWLALRYHLDEGDDGF